MKIEYSKNVDALYIKLREAKITDSVDIEEGVTVDVDETDTLSDWKSLMQARNWIYQTS